MRIWISVLLALVAVTPSLLSAERGRSDRKESLRCYAIRVQPADSENGASGRRARATHFSARDVQDLRVDVVVPEAMASEPLSVKLFTPRGRLYQVLDLTAGAPDDVETNRGGRRNGRSYSVLSARFPVAGTQITSFDLFGDWRVEAYQDGSERPCVRAFEFELVR